jgi:hypothetical protein
MITYLFALFFGAVILITVFKTIIPLDIACVLGVLLLWFLSYLPDSDRQADKKNDQP